MKKFIALFLSISFISSLAFSQDVIEKYFEHYLDDPDFTTVKVSPKLFEMLSGIQLDDMDPDVKNLIDNLKGLRILQTNKNSMQHFKKVYKAMSNKGYDTLMDIRDKGEQIKFYIKESGNRINELILLVGGEKEFVFMSFVGDISLNSISKLANKMNFKGSEHLGKLRK